MTVQPSALRIVSLVPSVTETLLAWSVIPVAVTRFCEHDEFTVVGGTKDPDVENIIGLQPDLVLMCDEENRIEDARALTDANLEVHVLRIRSLADVEPQLDGLRTRIGLPIQTRHPQLPSAHKTRVTAFVPIWRQPGPGSPRYHTLSADTYGSSLLAEIGVMNVFADLANRYAEVDGDQVRSRAPGIVIAPSEPYPFSERHRAELSTFAPVVFADGQDLFWWGARTPGAVRRLAAGVEAALDAR